MEPHLFETLSTLIDGEAADPDVLDAALHDPEAIPLLVEAVRLRLALQASAATPSADARRRCEAAMRAEAARLGRRWRPVALAAAIAVAVVGAWAVGMEVGGRHGPLWGPGSASSPAGVATSTAAAGRGVPGSIARPSPTDRAAGAGAEIPEAPRRTLRFEPARNWHEGSTTNDGL